MSGPIATYLDEIDDVLAFDPRLSRRVRDEIESHLCDTAEQVGEADAVRRASGAPPKSRAPMPRRRCPTGCGARASPRRCLAARRCC